MSGGLGAGGGLELPLEWLFSNAEADELPCRPFVLNVEKRQVCGVGAFVGGWRCSKPGPTGGYTHLSVWAKSSNRLLDGCVS